MCSRRPASIAQSVTGSSSACRSTCALARFSVVRGRRAASQSRGTSAWQSSQSVDTQEHPSRKRCLLSRGSQVRVLPGAPTFAHACQRDLSYGWQATRRFRPEARRSAEREGGPGALYYSRGFAPRNSPTRFRLRAKRYGETSPKLEERRRAPAGTPAPRSALGAIARSAKAARGLCMLTRSDVSLHS